MQASYQSCVALYWGKDKIHVKIAQARTGFWEYLAIIVYVCTLVDMKKLDEFAIRSFRSKSWDTLK